MTTAKIAISIEETILNRLEIEYAKLNPDFEQALADEHSAEIDEWPEY